MDDDIKRKLQDQVREFPETMDLLARVRTALAEQLFKTQIGAKEAREDLYLRVQTIDAMTEEMGRLLAGAADQQAIDAYAEQIAGKAKD